MEAALISAKLIEYDVKNVCIPTHAYKQLLKYLKQFIFTSKKHKN